MLTTPSGNTALISRSPAHRPDEICQCADIHIGTPLDLRYRRLIFSQQFRQVLLIGFRRWWSEVASGISRTSSSVRRAIPARRSAGIRAISSDHFLAIFSSLLFAIDDPQMPLVQFVRQRHPLFIPSVLSRFVPANQQDRRLPRVKTYKICERDFPCAESATRAYDRGGTTE